MTFIQKGFQCFKQQKENFCTVVFVRPPPLPLMFSLSDAIPRQTIRKTMNQLRAIKACIDLAIAQDVRAVVAARPKPLIIHERHLFTERARGFGPLNLIPVLDSSGPISQLLPSRWPHRPSNSQPHQPISTSTFNP